MGDIEDLQKLNEEFLEAWRQGSWEILRPVLSESFAYIDGATGQVWQLPRYIEALQQGAQPNLRIDEVAIHVDGDAAVVTARSSARPDKYSRYVDIYHRRGDGWQCVSACVWPLVTTPAGVQT